MVLSYELLHSLFVFQNYLVNRDEMASLGQYDKGQEARALMHFKYKKVPYQPNLKNSFPTTKEIHVLSYSEQGIPTEEEGTVQLTSTLGYLMV